MPGRSDPRAGPPVPPDLADRVLSSYPAPVARPYLALTQHEPGAGAFGCLLDTFEGLLHFLAVVAVSAYMRSGLGRPEYNRLLAERALKGGWSTGDLLALLRDTLRHAGDCDGHLPYPELPAYLFAGGRPTAAARALDELVGLRNRAWGHGTGRTDDALAAAFTSSRPRLEAQLAGMPWLTSWQLVRAQTVEEGALTRARLLMGVRRDRVFEGAVRLDPADEEAGRARPQASLLLVSSDGGRYLPLFPLALFPAGAERRDAVYLLQGCEAYSGGGATRLKHADYVAYEAGLSKHRERADDPSVRMLQEMIQRLLPAAPVPAAPARPVPRQLPRPPADFVGRGDLLDRLAEQARAGVAISGLHGLGGVGKTALALKLAERLGRRFPDGHVYLDLKGVSPRPVTWQEAMAHVLRAFHPDQYLPSDDAELAGAYRSALNGRRVLLLLDNAAGREQVEPLLPAGGESLVLVTSRRRFHLPGLATCDLDALPPDDAAALLRSIAPRLDPAAAAEIAAECGCLPLALRLAGATLAERDDWSAAHYLRRLRGSRLGMLDGVAASLQLSEALLPEPLRERWRELTVLAGSDFEAPWAAAVWGADDVATDEYLGALRRGSLLGWDGAAGLYRLHDLVREYARRRLDPAARAEAERRHARHFCGVVGGAAALFEQGGASIGLALRLFDRTWANVQAAFARAWARGPEDAEMAALCRDYANPTWRVRDLRQHPTELLAWSEAALDCARQLGDRPGEARALGNLGIVYFRLGRLQLAVEQHEQRLTIAREAGDRQGEAHALGNLGLIYADWGQPGRAVEFHEKDLAIAREVGDRRGEGRALGNLGAAHYALGRPQQAVEVYRRALAIARQVGDRCGEGEALVELGNVHGALGQRPQAVEFHRQGLAIAREVGDRRNEALASWYLGNTLAKMGHLADSISYMEVYVNFEREINYPDADRDAAYLARLRQRLAPS